MRIRSAVHEAFADREQGSSAHIIAAESGDGGDVLLAVGDRRVHSLARAAFDPDDPLARMARSLRGSIVASANRDGKGAVRSVAVMGLNAATEASILAANLAISYAQLGTQTVLVEANVGSALQGTLFSATHDKGLLEVLNGEVDARATVAQSAVRGLWIMTAGVAGGDAMVLLDGERFHRRAMPLLDAFGMMVVDVGISFSDPPTMCEALDAAIIVVRRDITPIADIRRLADRLEEMKTPIVGTVLAT
jgi:Mrp family chromosome partitioning ATPase